MALSCACRLEESWLQPSWKASLVPVKQKTRTHSPTYW